MNPAGRQAQQRTASSIPIISDFSPKITTFKKSWHSTSTFFGPTLNAISTSTSMYEKATRFMQKESSERSNPINPAITKSELHLERILQKIVGHREFLKLEIETEPKSNNPGSISRSCSNCLRSFRSQSEQEALQLWFDLLDREHSLESCNCPLLQVCSLPLVQIEHSQ